LIARDPETGCFYKRFRGKYLPIDKAEVEKAGEGSDSQSKLEYGSYHEGFVPFTHQLNYTEQVVLKENLFTSAAALAMLGSCAAPIYRLGLEGAMNEHGPLIAISGTMLSLSALGFSRRYLHGEFMYGRFSTLLAGMSVGFNMIAMAPNLVYGLAGWSLIGFSSTFLIGAYNDRPTVRENAGFAFAAYQLSDYALFAATAFSAYNAHAVQAGGEIYPVLTASGLITAALLKSSQFPLTNLFSRSMEGAAPTSALGYAALSSHAGVVLLSSTTALWFDFDWARATIATVGLLTAANAGIVSKIRADRKGALAIATSGSVGMIYCILAAGYTDMALLLSLGHASLRMTQFLRSANVILDHHNLHSALGHEMGSKVVSERLYRLAWGLNRMNCGFYLPQAAHMFKFHTRSETEPLLLSKVEQYVGTGVMALLGCAPFTPLAYWKEEALMGALVSHPCGAASLMALHVAASTLLLRYMLTHIHDFRRFRHREKAKSF